MEYYEIILVVFFSLSLSHSRHMKAADKDNPPALKVERLVLHQSSPSPTFSSHSHSDRGVGLRPIAQSVGASLGIQRPETSRGRLVRSSNTQHKDAEPYIENHESSLEEEPSWRTRKDREKKEKKMEEEEEERKRTEREEWSLRERNEEKERERKKTDREVEEERERLLREKERRMRLLREELRRDEEEEEKQLKEESEKRLR